MPGCAVTDCCNYNRNTKGTGIKYFRFPKNEELSKRWEIACRRNDKINLKNACICSIHFDSNCFEDMTIRQRLSSFTGKNIRNIKPDAIPTLNLPGKRKTSSNPERSARLAKRRLLNDSTCSINKSGDDNLENSNTSSHGSFNNHENFVCEITEANVVDQSDNSDKDKLICELKKQIATLEEENASLLDKYNEIKNELNRVNIMLGKFLSPGQIKRIFHPETTSLRWSPEDIASAISLRSVSPKAYRYLRTNGFPLPALSTVRSWASSFSINPGILNDVIILMEKKAAQLSKTEKLCILSFDEVYVSNRIDIETNEQKVIGPHKTCQTVMVRGLVSNWKQPVFYNFDQPMTKDILNEIISKLYAAGYTVVAIVSDMGSSNVGMWSKIGIGHDKNCSFQHPSNGLLKVFVFADVPHLIKLLRNHLLDHGFWVENTLVDKTCFECLLNISTSELSIAFKISRYHLEVKSSQRQNVKLAVQLLSNSVSKAIEYCGKNGLMPSKVPWEMVSKFVQLINEWFDVFNSRTKFVANYPSKNAFGTDLEKQRNILKNVSDVIGNMTVGNHKSLIAFQKGILLSNRSLEELFDYLHSNYKDIEYILTSRLNQDVLENFFSYIRGMGAANDHPHPLDFMYRLRWFILGKNSAAVFTQNTNTEEHGEQCLVKPLESTDNKLQLQQTDEICLTQDIFGNLSKNLKITQNSYVCREEEKLMPYSFVEPRYQESDFSNEVIDSIDSLETKEQIHYEALKYIAGYVAYKFKDRYSNLGSTTCTINSSGTHDWIEFISRGGLLHPNNDLLEAAQTLDSEFHLLYGTSLSKQSNIFTILADKTIAKTNTTIPYEVIYCLSRTRTYIRLRDLNKQVSLQNLKKKMEKKISKFTNSKNKSR